MNVHDLFIQERIVDGWSIHEIFATIINLNQYKNCDDQNVDRRL